MLLIRQWDISKPWLTWALLNPSTADGETEDPTSRKVIGFSERFGCGGALIVNPSAYRATHPKDLKAAGYPIGPENHAWIERALDSSGNSVICGWGANGRGIWCVSELIALFKRRNASMYALQVSPDNTPWHPLMLPYSLKPSPWGVRA